MNFEFKERKIEIVNIRSLVMFRVISKHFIPIRQHWLKKAIEESNKSVVVPWHCNLKACMVCNDLELSGQGVSKVYLIQEFNDLGKALPEIKALNITSGVESNIQKALQKNEGSSKIYNRMIRVSNAESVWLTSFSEVVTPTTSIPYPAQDKTWRDAYLESFRQNSLKDFEHSVELYRAHTDIVAKEASKATEEEWKNRFVLNCHVDRFPNGFISTSVYKEDKGQLGGSCNVSACQLDGQAFFYNQNMQKYYCYQCACDHHADLSHKRIQSYDPNIFELAESQGYTLTLAQVEKQRDKEWIVSDSENARN